MIPAYMPGAEPILLKNNDEVGCVLLHGIMASPAEMRWLAEHLAAQGYSVSVPCLPGHGRHPEDMRGVRWQDWVGAARDACQNLQTKRVMVVGHSMGGLLGLYLAAQERLAGVVGLAVPLRFTDWRVRWAGWLQYVVPFTDQSDTTDFPAYLRAEQARLGEPVLGRVRYDRWATAGVHQLFALRNAVASSLAAIKTPLCLIYSHRDPTAPASNATLIATGVSSQQIEQHFLTESGHILTQDCERERVFGLVSAFVGRATR